MGALSSGDFGLAAFTADAQRVGFKLEKLSSGDYGIIVPTADGQRVAFKASALSNGDFGIIAQTADNQRIALKGGAEVCCPQVGYTGSVDRSFWRYPQRLLYNSFSDSSVPAWWQSVRGGFYVHHNGFCNWTGGWYFDYAGTYTPTSTTGTMGTAVWEWAFLLEWDGSLGEWVATLTNFYGQTLGRVGLANYMDSVTIQWSHGSKPCLIDTGSMTTDPEWAYLYYSPLGAYFTYYGSTTSIGQGSGSGSCTCTSDPWTEADFISACDDNIGDTYTLTISGFTGDHSGLNGTYNLTHAANCLFTGTGFTTSLTSQNDANGDAYRYTTITITDGPTIPLPWIFSGDYRTQDGQYDVSGELKTWGPLTGSFGGQTYSATLA